MRERERCETLATFASLAWRRSCKRAQLKRFQRRAQLNRFQRLSPESQTQNLALTVVCVPYPLDSAAHLLMCFARGREARPQALPAHTPEAKDNRLRALRERERGHARRRFHTGHLRQLGLETLLHMWDHHIPGNLEVWAHHREESGVVRGETCWTNMSPLSSEKGAT